MPTTFWAGFVLAAAFGVIATVVVVLRQRARQAAQQSEDAARLAISDATRPLADTLARIEGQIREFESQRQHAMGGIDTQLTTLGKDTVALTQALRGTNARGRWGELTLRRVAELSGMTAQCDFYEQVQDASGRRPDMLVRLPGGRTLAVDAKAPLAGYLDAESAPDAAGRGAALDRHAQQLWRHVNDLSTREYWGQFDTTPEMVILFLPGEHFLSAALERRNDLLDAALTRKVLIATPVTLVSVLKGAALGWRQERLAKNAEELRRIAGEFHERVRTFGETYADAGRALQRALDAYNKSAASWDSRLMPSLKRMRELGVGAEPAELPRIDTAARLPRPIEPDAPPVAPDRVA